MKKQRLSEEFIRMQRLAGILTESQYIALNEEPQSLTTAQAAKITSKVNDKIGDKLKKDPRLDKLAYDIAKNPAHIKNLLNFLKKQGINVASLTESLEDDMAKLTVKFVKMADEEMTEDYDTTRGWKDETEGEGSAVFASAVAGAGLGLYLTDLGAIAASYGIAGPGMTGAQYLAVTMTGGAAVAAAAAAAVIVTLLAYKAYRYYKARPTGTI